ncbi:YgiQ family radical SAM protein [bacterium]
MNKKFIPISKQDMRERGWQELDIILITGDAYVDHHSYGTAVIGRVLEEAGYRVGIIAQPDWHNADDFKKLGRPRLFFGITSGNIDSMVANYTANKKRRQTDVYSPDGEPGKRPDRALIVYANKVREAFKDVPIVLGGLEASMRRLSHYDYWSGKVRRSIIMDAKADMIIYGMAERQIIEIAERINSGEIISEINDIRGSVVVRNDLHVLEGYKIIPSFEEVSEDKIKFNEAFKLFYEELSPKDAKSVVQKHGDKYVVQMPPDFPLTEKELDEIYELPYERACHPVYKKCGGVKGFNSVKDSIVSHRGCLGECSFCGLGLHQGRMIQSRSERSVLDEAQKMSENPNFKGIFYYKTR